MSTHAVTVSIITAAYNAAAFLPDTIRSIQAQSFTDWELIVTDDCSTDRTADVVRSFAADDARIRLCVLEKNSGPAVARNHSIEQARGRYIAFCDSDDCWYPTKLEKQLAFMQEKQCALCYCSYHCAESDNSVYKIVPARETVDFRAICRYNYIGCLTAIYDTQKVGKMFMPFLKKRQDWGLWIQIIQAGGTACGLSEPLALYHSHRKGSVSHNKSSLVQYNTAVYHEVLGYGRLHSCLCFFFVNFPAYLLKKRREKTL